MKRYYKIAETEICIEADDRAALSAGRELSLFACSPSEKALRCDIEITDFFPPPEGEQIVRLPTLAEYRLDGAVIRYIGPLSESVENAAIRTEYRDNRIGILLDSRVYSEIRDSVLLDAIGAERLVIKGGGVILHASYIEYGGEAILFTAPSGTGKSTQAELCRSLRGAEVINGDRAVIGVRDGRAYAYGLPYSGSSGICLNRTLPLKAIVYLGQAKENSIARLCGFEAFRRVWEGCCVNTWDKESTAFAADIVGNIISRVPVFYLRCLPEAGAVQLLEKLLFKE